MLYKGMVLKKNQSFENNKSKNVRIIWINKQCGYVCFVYIDGDGSMPKAIRISQIEEGLNDGTYEEISDPYNNNKIEAQIPVRYKKIRDKRWQVVEYLWGDQEPKILVSENRAQLIRQASERFQMPENSIRYIIKRFWKAGMNKNSLLPEYENSGAKGNNKRDTVKKRGRPRKISINGQEIEGINITNDIKEIIRCSLKSFYWNKSKKSLMEVYHNMLEKYFSDITIVNNKLNIQVWNKNRIPSYHTFYYWYKKFTNFEKNFVSRNSSKEFDLHYRELLGSVRSEAFGPGSKYQIDATPADVYLVSTIDPKRIIGRPIVYAVIDVYSRLITGIYVGLEGPSWAGAMMALNNVINNKVEYCKQYGIDIREKDWPTSYLPETLLADRGEFEGYNAENLINNLNVKVQNTSPYRGDLKSIVERYFRTINEKIKHNTPGAIQKEYRERGDRDYRLDAKLNLKEFTAIMINLVLLHNKKIIDGYNRELGMVPEDVKPCPIDIWNWGVKNRKGGFIKKNADIVKLNLLPEIEVKITRKGIKLNNRLFYSCKEAMEGQWFINSDNKSIKAVYDPRNMNFIYIFQDNGNSFIKCCLLEKCKEYRELNYEEVVFLQELESELKEEDVDENNQNIAEFNTNIKEIIKTAKRRRQNLQYTESNTSRMKGIRKNRNEEKLSNRDKEFFELGKQEIEGQANNSAPDSPNEEKYMKKSKIDYFKKRGEEKYGISK